MLMFTLMYSTFNRSEPCLSEEVIRWIGWFCASETHEEYTHKNESNGIPETTWSTSNNKSLITLCVCACTFYLAVVQADLAQVRCDGEIKGPYLALCTQLRHIESQYDILLSGLPRKLQQHLHTHTHIYRHIYITSHWNTQWSTQTQTGIIHKIIVINWWNVEWFFNEMWGSCAHWWQMVVAWCEQSDEEEHTALTSNWNCTSVSSSKFDLRESSSADFSLASSSESEHTCTT